VARQAPACARAHWDERISGPGLHSINWQRSAPSNSSTASKATQTTWDHGPAGAQKIGQSQNCVCQTADHRNHPQQGQNGSSRGRSASSGANRPEPHAQGPGNAALERITRKTGLSTQKDTLK